jgi:UDP-3-O-[3-hydroxymyristoyl] N-acetylglucosamine deacetylase
MQHTLARPASFAGVGVHSGAATRVRLCPAPADHGIVFRRMDLPAHGNLAPARFDAVSETRLGTGIEGRAGTRIATIEHLMAALAALCVDNALVEIDGPEVPIMDGSAAPFVQGLDRAGLRPLSAPRRYIEVLRTVDVTDGAKRAALSPASEFEVAFEICFDSRAIGRQAYELTVGPASFRRELADCRTFGFLGDFDALRAAGLARGASLQNVVVIDGDRVLNPEGLRRRDEFVRHKTLDAIGDLALLGAPLIGRYEGRYAGHGLNNALARALMADAAAWRYAYPDQELARAG